MPKSVASRLLPNVDDVAYVFRKRKPGIPELETWRGLYAQLQDRFDLGKGV